MYLQRKFCFRPTILASDMAVVFNIERRYFSYGICLQYSRNDVVINNTISPEITCVIIINLTGDDSYEIQARDDANKLPTMARRIEGVYISVTNS